MEARVDPLPRAATLLVWATAVLGLVAAGTSLIFPDVYRDGDWGKSQFLGQDAATVVIAIPLLLGAWWRSREGQLAPRFVLAGALMYFAYSYVLYAEAAAFNELYLVYLFTASASFFGLIATLAGVVPRLDGATVHRGARIGGAVYLLVLGCLLAFLWGSQIISGFAEGVEVAAQRQPLAPKNGIFLLDLIFIIPLCIAGGVLAIQDRAWGHLIVPLMLVKSATLGMALVAMTVGALAWGVEVELFLGVFWAVMTVLSTGLAIAWLRTLRLADTASLRVDAPGLKVRADLRIAS